MTLPMQINGMWLAKGWVGKPATDTHWLRAESAPICRFPFRVRLYWPISDPRPGSEGR